MLLAHCTSSRHHVAFSLGLDNRQRALDSWAERSPSRALSGRLTSPLQPRQRRRTTQQDGCYRPRKETKRHHDKTTANQQRAEAEATEGGRGGQGGLLRWLLLLRKQRWHKHAEPSSLCDSASETLKMKAPPPPPPCDPNKHHSGTSASPLIPVFLQCAASFPERSCFHAAFEKSGAAGRRQRGGELIKETKHLLMVVISRKPCGEIMSTRFQQMLLCFSLVFAAENCTWKVWIMFGHHFIEHHSRFRLVKSQEIRDFSKWNRIIKFCTITICRSFYWLVLFSSVTMSRKTYSVSSLSNHNAPFTSHVKVNTVFPRDFSDEPQTKKKTSSWSQSSWYINQCIVYASISQWEPIQEYQYFQYPFWIDSNT